MFWHKLTGKLGVCVGGGGVVPPPKPMVEFSGYSPLKMRKERKVADASRVVFITLFIDSFYLNFSVILLYPLCNAYRPRA